MCGVTHLSGWLQTVKQEQLRRLGLRAENTWKCEEVEHPVVKTEES